MVLEEREDTPAHRSARRGPGLRCRCGGWLRERLRHDCDVSVRCRCGVSLRLTLRCQDARKCLYLLDKRGEMPVYAVEAVHEQRHDLRCHMRCSYHASLRCHMGFCRCDVPRLLEGLNGELMVRSQREASGLDGPLKRPTSHAAAAGRL